jgi:putative ribosome biogenesis GTPase RsgA
MTQAEDSTSRIEPQSGFFDRNNTLGAEIIEGFIREQQICVFAGPYCVGKSPLLADITVHCAGSVER